MPLPAASKGGTTNCIEARAATGIIVHTRTFGDVASQAADFRGQRMRCTQDMAYYPPLSGAAKESRPETSRDDAKWVCLALVGLQGPARPFACNTIARGCHRRLWRKLADGLAPGDDMS
jgi:hypothetical protein